MSLINRDDGAIAFDSGLRYQALMGEVRSYLELELRAEEPIEISDFVRAFASIGTQYDRFLRRLGYADIPSAKIYIKKIREGSIIAELIPILLPIINAMDAIIIVDSFAQMVRDRVLPYFTPGGRAQGATKSELKDLLGEVRAIANDPDGRSILRTVRLTEDGPKREAVLEFSTSDAKQAVREIEAHYEQLSTPKPETFENVLVVLFQSNKKMPDADGRSGERGIIESIDPNSKPIVYVSELARQRIKDEILYGDENIYKKGFYVDGIVDRFRDKVAAYKITNVREVIDLPDDE